MVIGKMIYHTVCIGFTLSFALLGKSSAQAVFSEGILTYRIDTLRRLEKQPASYIDVQFKLFKKGNLIRVEKLSVNRSDPTDIQRTIQIRNHQGIYTLLERKESVTVDSLANKLSISRDSLTKLAPILEDFAQFTSYEEEKADRATATLEGRLTSYTIKKTGQKSTFLRMPTEKFIITSSDKSDPVETQVTQSINVPVKLFFEALQTVEGTPLQFTEFEYGWLKQYTIESVLAKPVPKNLFEIDPKLKVLTTEQMIKELQDFKWNPVALLS